MLSGRKEARALAPTGADAHAWKVAVPIARLMTGATIASVAKLSSDAGAGRPLLSSNSDRERRNRAASEAADRELPEIRTLLSVCGRAVRRTASSDRDRVDPRGGTGICRFLGGRRSNSRRAFDIARHPS
jgi:hypothetical protein